MNLVDFDLVDFDLVDFDRKVLVARSLSNAGHAFIGDLLAARGMIHLGTDAAALPEPYRSRWFIAVEAKLGWNGFRRVSLSSVDREYLDGELQRSEDDDVL